MVTLTEKDKEYINKTKGTIVARGIHDHLNVLRQKFGEDAIEKIDQEMKNLGYDIAITKLKETEKIPNSFYMAFLVTEKKLFELDDEGVRDMGRGSARLSFLLRFASRLLVSLEMLRKNANTAWRKYYKEGGELRVVEIDKEKKRIVGEVHGFVGHPVHCRYLEGYFSEIIFFVIGKKAKCREENCIFDGEDVHRFIITWE